MPITVKKVFKGVLYVHLFLGVALLLSHCTLSRYAERSYREARQEKPYDVIIVPGIPYDKENTSSVMKMRMLWAKQLYDSGFTRNIIFSGGAVYTPYIESIVMKTFADSLGIPSSQTFSETKAEHSTENVYYSWKMAQGLGFRKIALATDPFQARMLKSFIKKYTPGVHTIPIVFKQLDTENQELPQIDPNAAYVNNFISIKERESFWERMKGTMGKRVKEEKRLEAREKTRDASASNRP